MILGGEARVRTLVEFHVDRDERSSAEEVVDVETYEVASESM
jgi:hypothetical protein